MFCQRFTALKLLLWASQVMEPEGSNSGAGLIYRWIVTPPHYWEKEVSGGPNRGSELRGAATLSRPLSFSIFTEPRFSAARRRAVLPQACTSPGTKSRGASWRRTSETSETASRSEPFLLSRFSQVLGHSNKNLTNITLKFLRWVFNT